MKEVNYEDWVKNPTPREMWVWNKEDGSDKAKRIVIYILNAEPYYFPVISVNKNSSHTSNYRYCAEIEELKASRMTNQELSWWLRDGKHREWKFKGLDTCVIHNTMCYPEQDAGDLVDTDILIREDGGEWREPLIEE